jgi:hypothetical protein
MPLAIYAQLSGRLDPWAELTRIVYIRGNVLLGSLGFRQVWVNWKEEGMLVGGGGGRLSGI